MEEFECNNCGDNFWGDPEYADELICPSCGSEDISLLEEDECD